MNIEILLNDFAIRCFRDIADQDYIAARAAYRSELFPQFHWLSLQAIEKYFKAILLLNRVKAKDINHDLEKALKYAKELPFELKLSPSTLEFIEHLDTFGRFRYLETSYYLHGPKLVELDHAVWEIRRYCKVMNYEGTNFKGGTMNMLKHETHIIDEMSKRSPHLYKLHSGVLENIISNKKHAARAALIWKNAFFGSKNRKKVRMRMHSHSTNAPLSLHPELLEEVEKYVFLPKDVRDAYRKKIEGNKKKVV
jgi:hypothetical protein